jgi:hypothetical protein
MGQIPLILCIERAEACEIMEILFRRVGYQVVSIQSAKDALRLAQKHYFAAVISEYLLEDLPADQKEVIVLGVFQDLSYAEIEDITGTKAVTLRSRMFHGLKRLARTLGAPSDAPPAAPTAAAPSPEPDVKK